MESDAKIPNSRNHAGFSRGGEPESAFYNYPGRFKNRRTSIPRLKPTSTPTSNKATDEVRPTAGGAGKVGETSSALVGLGEGWFS